MRSSRTLSHHASDSIASSLTIAARTRLESGDKRAEDKQIDQKPEVIKGNFAPSVEQPRGVKAEYPVLDRISSSQTTSSGTRDAAGDPRDKTETPKRLFGQCQRTKVTSNQEKPAFGKSEWH